MGFIKNCIVNAGFKIFLRGIFIIVIYLYSCVGKSSGESIYFLIKVILKAAIKETGKDLKKKN